MRHFHRHKVTAPVAGYVATESFNTLGRNAFSGDQLLQRNVCITNLCSFLLWFLVSIQTFCTATAATNFKAFLLWKYSWDYTRLLPYLALFMHSISSFMLCWFIVKLVWNSQILSVGKRKARKITRRGKNSHRYNLLRQLPFFWGGLFLGLWMSSHVKNFSYAHEFLRLFLWLQGLALALMETGLRTGRSRLHWDKTQRQRQDSLSSSYNGSCISQNAWFLCFK